MSESLIYFTLIILIALAILNLKLTLGLYKAINNPPNTNVSESGPVPIGEELPQVTAKSLTDNVEVPTITEGIPTVLLFLSSKCPTCKEKLPQIESIYNLTELAGLRLHLISTETKKRLNYFLQGNSLLHEVLITNKKDYKKLNPSLASPFYLFIDHENTLQTFGTVGDDDWENFVGQMQEIESHAGDDT